MVAALLLLSAAVLGGCSTSIGDMPIAGTPADAPERPKEAGAYLPVHDLPPDRGESISPTERARIQAELVAARERQAASGTAKDGTSSRKP